MSQHHARMHGRLRQRRNRALLAVSDVCGLCGHPGSDAVDHVIPLARGGTEDRANLQPAHHDAACATCGLKCNRLKADKLVGPAVRRSTSLRRPGG